MAEQCCGDCIYWRREKYAGAGPYDGKCRRHAPQAYQSMYLHTAELFGLMLWALEEHANVEHESFDYRCENQSPFSCWPETQEDEWCGEFRERST